MFSGVAAPSSTVTSSCAFTVGATVGSSAASTCTTDGQRSSSRAYSRVSTDCHDRGKSCGAGPLMPRAPFADPRGPTLDLRTGGEYDAGESLTQDGTPVSTHALSHLPMSVTRCVLNRPGSQVVRPPWRIASLDDPISARRSRQSVRSAEATATAAEVRRAGDERRDAFSDDEAVLAHRAIRRVMTSRQSGDAAAPWCMYLRARVSASRR